MIDTDKASKEDGRLASNDVPASMFVQRTAKLTSHATIAYQSHNYVIIGYEMLSTVISFPPTRPL